MCSNSENGCGWVGELRSLDNHFKTCEYTLLSCPNECTNNKKKVTHVIRCDLDFHLRNVCPNRQFECPHCKAMGKYCNIETTHLVKATCPNNGCGVKVPRCLLSNHRSTCQYEKVACKYAGIGCNEKLLRKSLQKHENDDTYHLCLAIETVTKQQRQINKLQNEMQAVKGEQDSIMCYLNFPCVFKMTEFTQHNSSKQEWYSPPLYTHPGGYKMCIEVDASGNGAAAGTHVSVFAYLMKGKNDDNLPWPFTGEVTITLLNQLEDENHHTRTISFSQDHAPSRRVVSGERAPKGYGFPQFISHNDLGAAQNYQYLNGDCLYFQVEVQAAKPVKRWLTCTI